MSRNLQEIEKKTPTQEELEILVTKGRGYEKIPYIKFLGQKTALQNWLLFSKTRLIKSSYSDAKIPFLDYLKEIIKEDKEKYGDILVGLLRYKKIPPEYFFYFKSFIKDKYSNLKK